MLRAVGRRILQTKKATKALGFWPVQAFVARFNARDQESPCGGRGDPLIVVTWVGLTGILNEMIVWAASAAQLRYVLSITTDLPPSSFMARKHYSECGRVCPSGRWRGMSRMAGSSVSFSSCGLDFARHKLSTPRVSLPSIKPKQAEIQLDLGEGPGANFGRSGVDTQDDSFLRLESKDLQGLDEEPSGDRKAQGRPVAFPVYLRVTRAGKEMDQLDEPRAGAVNGEGSGSMGVER